MMSQFRAPVHSYGIDQKNPNPYNILVEHFERFDRQMGAGYSWWDGKDVKIMKNCTIIIIGCMTLTLKVLAMLTLSMGTLI